MAGEIESMASNMRSKMGGDTISSSTPCIFRIPSILRRHNKEAYIPNAFSIGPFHHGKKDLEDKEKIKFNYLEGLLYRTRNPDTTLMECIKEIAKYETEARECYAEEIHMSKQAFIEMLVLDGCFIVELFRKDAGEVRKNENDPIFSTSCMLQFLHHDLILLENQIPWFVLEHLFRLTRGLSETKSLLQLALDFFDNIFSSEKSPIQLDLFANKKTQHMLDLIRSSLVLPLGEQQGQEESFVSWRPIPSATSIKESGISFRKVTSHSILEVKFRRGTLEMSPILIQETVEPAFRNLISYEQCYPNCPPRVTSYAILLDNLINNEGDMEELSKSGILINWLNPHDTTQFFKMLYHDAFLKEFHYQKLCGEVNEYQQKLWPKWRAFYTRNYFAKPWAIVSQIVAAIVLILAFLQTIYSMKC
ncbi:hypothetical protein SLEP1_g48930 [Rubroshorea leprosula]|uniref:Uncharacterized protein n=1 Tax=Rubroshorea leprosula TaxID=152421 RepID=A0AAV5LW29_9ROSI|nr:hypothetical protein SLEP1_g48930 [Rubroshorea leprosula]